MKSAHRRLWILVLVVTGTLVALFTVWNLRSTHRLEAAIAAVEQAGLPTRIEDIPAWLDARFGELPAGDNGAVQLEAALALLEGTDIAQPEWPEEGPQALPQIDEPSGAEVEQLDQAVELLSKALAAPRCRMRTQWEDGIAVELDFLLPVFGLANLLESRAILRVAAGDEDAALADAELLCRLPRVLAEEPTLLGWMVHLALIDRGDNLLRQLAERGFDPARLSAMAAAPPAGNAMHVMGGECAWALSAYHIVMDGAFAELGIGEPDPWQRFLQSTVILTPMLRVDLAHLLEHYLDFWELRDRTAAEALTGARTIQASMLPENPGIDSMFSSLLAANIAGALENEVAVRARMQATRDGLDQLIAWRDAPPSEPTERSFGNDDDAWTVRSR